MFYRVFDGEYYGTETVEADNWNKETDFVRAVVGSEFDIVYSSELEYDEYFKRGLPICKAYSCRPR